MKVIEIKTKHLTVEAICDLYRMVTEFNEMNPVEDHYTKEYRAIESIINEVMLMFENKRINKKEVKKPFKIKFTYHQAYFFTNFIFKNMSCLVGIDETRVRMLMSELHQKL